MSKLNTQDRFPGGKGFDPSQREDYSKINFGELDVILKIAEFEPENWDQQHFFSRDEEATTWCGTAACVAGHAILRAGYQPVGGMFQRYCWNTEAPDGTSTTDVREVAMNLLGLSDNQAGELFFAFNTLNDLKTIVSTWKTRAGYIADIS